MTQQINLLVVKSSGDRYAWLALAALGLLLLLLLGFWGIRQIGIVKAQTTRAASEIKLREAKAKLQAGMQQQKDNNLSAEIAVLRPQADMAQRILAQAEELGSQQGYARTFSKLATITEEGLWLTNVSVGKSGKSLRISGRALHKESIMRYAERLNAVFSDDGVQFTALELSPETVGKPGDDAKSQITALAFKLY